MKYYTLFIKINPIIYFLYKCVQCQDNVVPQGVQAQNLQNSQFPPPQEPQMNAVNDINEHVYLNNEDTTGPVDLNNTLEGNVLKQNPVEKLKELSKGRNARKYFHVTDISVEISQNPYYKIPGLTRKIREIAVLHPDLMEKLGVYVIPIPGEKEEHEEEGKEKSELESEETREGPGECQILNLNSEENMRSEIDELMDKTEMMKAMSPEEKLEYIPQLKEKIVYQILKNRQILQDLTEKMKMNHMADFENPQEAEGEEYYPEDQYYQGYENYPNYQGYEEYPNYQGYPTYPEYQNYPGYENYQNYPGYGY